MTTLRTLLAGLLTAFGLVTMTPATAHACSCAIGSTAQYVAGADVVFTGTLTRTDPPPRRPLMSSGDPATYHFDVDEVLKGDAPVNAQVSSAGSGASCGLENLTVGDVYLVYANGGRTLTANLCGGTSRAWPAKVARLERLVGPPTAPSAAVTDPAEDDGPPYAWLVVGGAGLLAAAAAALAMRRRTSHA